jgi:hypothetical protein
MTSATKLKPWNVSNHDQYDNIEHIWNKIDYAYNVTMKENAHKLFPPPFGTLDEALKNNQYIKDATKYLETPIANGSDYSGAALAYYEGGHVPTLVPHTISSFSSIANQHEATVGLPDQLEYLRNGSTKDGKTIHKLFSEVLNKVLRSGRGVCVVDIDLDENKLKIVLYPTKSLIDWGSLGVITDDRYFRYCIIKDKRLNPDFNPIDSSSNQRYIDIIFHHKIVDGKYVVEKQESINNEVLSQTTITPKFMGKTIDFIPVIAIGSIDNTPDVDPPPLEGISECVVQIYKLTCLLYHAQRTSSVPTMYGTGMDEDSTPDVTGADVFIPLADTQSHLGYTKTDTSQMAHIQDRIDGFYFQAQELGASLLGARKGTSESGEALRLRQAASTSTLKSIVSNVGNGIESLLKMIATWANASGEIRFDPNKEFSAFALTANETIALLQTWQGKAISHSTFLENLRKAGMLKPGETVEDEIATMAIDGETFVDPDSTSVAKLNVGENLPPKKPLDKKVM